jgi:hypothetical protein
MENSNSLQCRLSEHVLYSFPKAEDKIHDLCAVYGAGDSGARGGGKKNSYSEYPVSHEPLRS